MVRSIIVLLLLVVFFLSGVLYGIERNSSADNGESDVTDTSSIIENREVEMELDEQPIKEDIMDREPTAKFTEKTASFLEAGVNGFYEVVVQILYSVAQLFF